MYDISLQNKLSGEWINYQQSDKSQRFSQWISGKFSVSCGFDELYYIEDDTECFNTAMMKLMKNTYGEFEE